MVIGFFTRLPMGRIDPPLPLSDGAIFFPVAGLVVGAAAGLLIFLGLAIHLPSSLALLIGIGGSIILTGGLHEDGLADTADALGVRGDREKKLAVLKDSRIGAFGALALILSVFIRVEALAGMDHPWRMIAALIASHVLARAILPTAMRAMPLLHHQGAAAAAGQPSGQTARIALGIGLLLSVLLIGPEQALIGFASAFIAAFLLSRVAAAIFGGYNGDILGAIEQCAEIAVLINLRSFV